MAEHPEQQPSSQPPRVPPPGQVPKLPKTIWNLEKKVSASPGRARRS